MNSKIFAGKLLSATSKTIGESLATYSSWLLVGFGAALTLILANIKTITEYIDVSNIKYSVYLFLIALLIGVIQRLLFTILASSIKSGSEGERLGKEEDEQDRVVDFEVVFTEMLAAAYWPVNKLIEPQLEKIKNGDFAVAGRMQYKMAIIGSFLTLLMALLAAGSIVMLVAGVHA